MILTFIFILAFLSGAGKGTSDRILLPHHYNNSIFPNMKNQQFLNPEISSKNKYKNQDKKQGSRFPGSTHILVFTTDLLHLSQSILINNLCGIAILTPFVEGLNFWGYVLLALIVRIVFAGGFYLFYKKLLIKK